MGGGGLNFDLCNHRMGDNSVDRSYLVHQTMVNQTRQLRIRYYERKQYLSTSTDAIIITKSNKLSCLYTSIQVGLYIYFMYVL